MTDALNALPASYLQGCLKNGEKIGFPRLNMRSDQIRDGVATLELFDIDRAQGKVR